MDPDSVSLGLFDAVVYPERVVIVPSISG